MQCDQEYVTARLARETTRLSLDRAGTTDALVSTSAPKIFFSFVLGSVNTGQDDCYTDTLGVNSHPDCIFVRLRLISLKLTS